jgi:hypothetical protein
MSVGADMLHRRRGFLALSYLVLIFFRALGILSNTSSPLAPFVQ